MTAQNRHCEGYVNRIYVTPKPEAIQPRNFEQGVVSAIKDTEGGAPYGYTVGWGLAPAALMPSTGLLRGSSE